MLEKTDLIIIQNCVNNTDDMSELSAVCTPVNLFHNITRWRNALCTTNKAEIQTPSEWHFQKPTFLADTLKRKQVQVPELAPSSALSWGPAGWVISVTVGVDIHSALEADSNYYIDGLVHMQWGNNLLGTNNNLHGRTWDALTNINASYAGWNSNISLGTVTLIERFCYT